MSKWATMVVLVAYASGLAACASSSDVIVGSVAMPANVDPTPTETSSAEVATEQRAVESDWQARAAKERAEERQDEQSRAQAPAHDPPEPVN